MLSQIRKISADNKVVAAGLLLTGIMIASSGCGKNGANPISTLVNDVKLKTYSQNGDQWMDVTIMLTTGGFTLAGINLPVINPEDPTKMYGELTMVPNLCMTNPCNAGGELRVALNLTQTTQMQGVDIRLPNGTALPVGGLQNATVVALPIAQTGAKIYLAFGQGVAMFGAAIPFSALDPAGKYLPGVNVFQPLTFEKVNLIAGIFAGATPNSTGVGLFLDLSSVLNQNIPPVDGLLASRDSSPDTTNGMILPWRNGVNSIVTFGPVKPSLSTERKMYQKLYNLSRQNLTLSIQ